MTDEELERKIEGVYRRAAEETSQKLNQYTQTFERLDAEKKDTLPPDEYAEWRRRQITTGKRWEAMTNSLARDVLQADNEARDLINEYVPEAFADGYNYSCYQMANSMGDDYLNGSFTLYNKQAVERLVRDNPDLLPQLNPNSKTAEDIRAGKIIQWNKSKINSEVTQGILQGESIGKIAKRMQNVVGMEKNASIRNARTATNGARNAGKEESFKDAEELGIDVEQMWVASVDDRTRYEHRQLDGQTVKVGEKFKVDGFEIAYPCDPTAEPSMVYNCRCTIIPYLPKYQEKPDPHPSVSDEKYEAWKEEQNYHGEEEKEQERTVEEKPVYEMATNREEAEQLLQDVGFNNIEGADEISDKLLVENANQLAMLDERFDALGEGRSIFIGEITDPEDALAYVNPKTTNLHVNSDYFYNTRVLRNTVERGQVPDDTGRPMSMPVAKEHYDTAVITHEYGHMVQQKIWEDKGLSKFSEDGETLTEEYRAWTTEVANEIYQEAYNSSSENDPDKLWNDQVGTYAEVNTQEFFAECFMNAFCGAPNDFGNAMLKWLEKEGY